MRARRVRVELAAGRGGSGLCLVRAGHGLRNSLCGLLSVEPKHMSLISSKIAQHVDVLKLFPSIALRTVGLHQLLHYDVTTHCCETSDQTLVMWQASDHLAFSNATVAFGEQ